MKKLLWRPGTVTWQIHLLIAIIAVIALVIVESFQISVKQPFYKEKVKAAEYMLQGMDIIKRFRIKHHGPINRVVDPTRSGLIGVLSSPITSTTVDIDAKLTTLNPNWAAVIVSMFHEAGVKRGATVAVSFTGSFPAMNLAVLSAAKALGLRLIIISSVSSSTWGANIPGCTWLDMENELIEQGFSNYRSVAASIGGVKDIGLGMPEEGKAILRDTARRYGITLLEFNDLKKNITARMEIYHDAAKDSQIAAYVNVGGGTVAVGSFIGKRRFRPGLNLKPPPKAMKIDSVMARFAREGVPILNINYMKTLAQQYRLPVGIKKIPKIGEGEIYWRMEYNKWLVLGMLLFLLLCIYLFMRLGIGDRILIPFKKPPKGRKPDHMV